ncbi:group II intron reverse transcriptase/maturase [Candidatus Regiella endosymbiont of Tuberolachnus salignus]|uniref:group II intron reverse transcriptase/maturase n=1 Tax=Candidatus Regiella endosymbiont of Tuberolachnus salignus TaxID=3077956 RepID=UPI0030D44084
MRTSYKLAKENKGAPGVDGVTFEEIESTGVDNFLESIRKDLLSKTYYPLRNRKRAIPKAGGQSRMLSIPTIRDRVVQGAVKLILEAIFEADFQPGSFGYRPKRTAAEAVEQVTVATIKNMTRVIDVDLKSYFDTVRHDILLSKIATRVNDKEVMRLLKLILKAGGKCGVPQGGPLSPLLSNIYLNEVDKMLERAKAVTGTDGYQHIEYARWADDLIIMIDSHRKWDWLAVGVYKRLKEELMKLGVTLNLEKTRQVELKQDDSFSFLGFVFRRTKTKQGKWGVMKTPKMDARTRLLQKLKAVFRRHQSQPIDRVIYLINPILRGWVNYYRIGNSSRCFTYVKDWVEKKARRHLMKARRRQGFGWGRWSKEGFYQKLGLYSDYKIRYYPVLKVSPAR